MNKLLSLTIILLLHFSAYTQSKMKVDRCADIDRSAPIQNIYIDDNNQKWVSDFKGLYLAQSPDHAQIVKVPAEEWSILNMVDGNMELSVPRAELASLMGDAFDDINCNAYDRRSETLYVGTTESGVYHFKVKPKLQLIKTIDTGNSKLKSDFINTIHIEESGQIWIGSALGILTGSGSKWELLEKNFDITSIAINGAKIFLLGDGETVIELDARNKGYLTELPDDAVEGEIKDIAVDSKGRLWVASEIVTLYDEAAEDYDVFGPAENFTSQFVTRIAVDQDDALWVGTEDKGVYFIGNNLSMTASLVVEKALSCNPGAKDAVLQARASGGEPPYSFKWKNDEKGQQIKDIGPGEYAVTITDSKGRTVSAQTTIEDSRLTVNAVAEQVASSGGGADGRAKVTVSGGTAPYNFNWDNGETVANARKLTMGSHSVTISDRTGCSTTATVEIGEGLAPLSINFEQTKEINCNGEKTAALMAEVSGGQAPYQYKWSGAGADKSLENLAAGNYSLTITDANGTTTSSEFTIPEPAALSASVSVQSPASTNNADGKAAAKATGGKGSYTYQWDTGETTATAIKLAVGDHSVTITDASGCTATTSISMSENIDQLIVNINPTATIKCFGATDGAVEVAANGGKPPFKYQWSDAGLSGEKASGLKAGNYEITVTDAAGNQQTATISLEQPEELAASVSVQASASTGGSDGKATVKAKGGSGTYTYKWDNGETDKKAEQLAAGTHDVTITDGSGCTAVASVEISENILPLAVNINVAAENNCFGDKGATLEVEVSGGKPPFEYQWSDTALNGEKPSSVGAGTYQVSVTDATGTVQGAGINLKDPEQLTVSITPKSPASTGNADGKATAKGKGGSGKYSYQWDSGESSDLAEKLSPGKHTVTVTDEKGCTATAEIEITEDILPLTVAINQTTEVPCAGSKGAGLEVEVNGGKAPFEFQWSDTALKGEKLTDLTAGTYLVTVTDVAGTTQTAEVAIKEPTALTVSITPKSPASTGNSDGKATAKAKGGSGKYTYQWDSGETNDLAEKLNPGNHTVTVTDEKGCTATAEIEITEDILPLTVDITQIAEVQCAGDRGAGLEVEVSGGKAPFEFQWSNADLKGEKLTGLVAGNYLVTVTDVTGTTQTAELDIKEPTALTASITPKSPASTGNSDGQATAKASGGTGNYTYKWDNGESAALATTLSPGKHTVTITDENGCNSTAEIEITENILPLTIAINQTAENKCFGDKTASIEVEVNGGKGPFRYTWSDAALKGKTPLNLAAGKYDVTVIDDAGSAQTASVTVAEPAELTLTATVDASATTNNEDGKATAKGAGGSGDYQYEWGNGETSSTAVRLSPSSHSVTVMDGNGCTAIASVDITEDILPMTVAVDQTVTSACQGDNGGAITVTVKGGKSPYEYQWGDDKLSGNEATNLPPGKYQLTVSDVSGQSKSVAITIEEPAELTAEITKKRPATNEDSKDGKAELAVNGGTAPYSYKWDNEETTANAEKLTFGAHSVTVSDSNGCSVSLNFETEKKIMPDLTAGRLRAGQTLRLEKLYFEADSTRMTDTSIPLVNEIYEFLEDNPKVVIEVGGHTNGIPEHDFCDWLSTERAKHVAGYIVNKGIDPARVVYKGYGKRKPLMSNKSELGRKRNQRVEVKILDLGLGDG